MMKIPMVMMDDDNCDDSTNDSAIREIMEMKLVPGSRERRRRASRYASRRMCTLRKRNSEEIDSPWDRGRRGSMGALLRHVSQ